MQMNPKKLTFWMLRTIVSLALIAVLLNIIGVERVLEKIGSFNTIYLIPIIVITLGVLLINTLNLKILLSPLGEIGYWQLFKKYCVSFSIGYIAPGKIGDFSLSYLLRKKFKKRETSAIIFLDKIVTLVLFSLLSVCALFFFFGFETSLRVLVFLIIIFLLLVFFFFTNIGNRVFSKLLFGRFEKSLHGFLEIFRSYFKKRKRLVLANLFFTVIRLFLQSAIILLILQGFNAGVDYFVLLLIVPASTIISMIPITVSGLGIREGTTAFLLQEVSVHAPTALSTAFLATIIDYLFVTIILSVFASSKILKK